jgi:hypothetical protein
MKQNLHPILVTKFVAKASPYPDAASPADFSRSWGAHAVPEHLTFPAYLHLAAPAGLRFSMTHSPVDKPAEVARVEFPGGTVAARFQGTLPHLPAAPGLFCLIILQRKQK